MDCTSEHPNIKFPFLKKVKISYLISLCLKEGIPQLCFNHINFSGGSRIFLKVGAPTPKMDAKTA